MRPSPSELANNVDDSGSNARVFILVHQALLYPRPSGEEGLGVYEGEAVECDNGLLAHVRMRVA